MGMGTTALTFWKWGRITLVLLKLTALEKVEIEAASGESQVMTLLLPQNSASNGSGFSSTRYLVMGVSLGLNI